MTEENINSAWERATKVDNFDSNQFRKDACGAWIIRSHYGQRDSVYGWEVDHVYPQSMGGGDDMENLRAMQWENNMSKGDDYPDYKAVVQSEGNKNVRKEGQFTVNAPLQATLKKLYDIK
ncbi:MAG: HNH endonuclease [Prevotella sp.]|nr:HNH endonuclease [Prevotella sp.]